MFRGFGVQDLGVWRNISPIIQNHVEKKIDCKTEAEDLPDIEDVGIRV